VTQLSRDTTWWSRLATDGLSDVLGFEPEPNREIPHVRGLPVPLDVPVGSVQIREWPNIAGRLEPAGSADLVRWDRSLAPEPPTGTVVSYGVAPEPGYSTEMLAWFAKFVRSLEQVPGVARAVKSETPRAIVLTPCNLDDQSDRPDGLVAVPRRLAEFPGGAIVTMRPNQWDHRSAYADEIRDWLGSTAANTHIR
jgi:hypothetical protein